MCLREVRSRMERGELDPLVRYLVPVVLERIEEETGALEDLRVGWAEGRTGEPSLQETSERVDALGWVLAALASAAGMNLVQERREEHGLQHMVELLGRALGEEGVVLEPGGVEVSLSPRAPEGWPLPWAVGSLLLAASLGDPAPERVQWSLERGAVGCCRVPRSEWVLPLWREGIAPRLPEASLIEVDEHLELRFPRAWLRGGGLQGGSG